MDEEEKDSPQRVKCSKVAAQVMNRPFKMETFRSFRTPDRLKGKKVRYRCLKRSGNCRRCEQ